MDRPDPPGVEQLIEQLAAGVPSAREVLLERTAQRLRRFVHRILRSNPRIRVFEDTDDVLQNSCIRLWRALSEVRPSTAAAYFGLAAKHIRWELIDLVKKHYGPEGWGSNVASQEEAESRSELRPAYDRPDSAPGPSTLAEWTEFHEKVGELPEAERSVFDLLFYHGLSQEEAATILGVNVRTIKRRWRDAKLLLREITDY